VEEALFDAVHDRDFWGGIGWYRGMDKGVKGIGVMEIGEVRLKVSYISKKNI
jgi:hypothetical protein